MVLESVVSQRLLPRADQKGRIACFEVMHCNTAVRSLIRDNKTFQIPGVIQTGSRSGMVTLEDSLVEACRRGDITAQTALEYAPDINAVRMRLQAAGIG